MTGRILIAGVGNIFLSDDGFGVEVVRRLRMERLPENVSVGDFGIKGIHLAYELLDGYETLILIDALPRGEEPGTVFLLRPDVDALPSMPADAHGMEPAAMFAFLRSLGGTIPQTFIVGCEPMETEEAIGLSAPVERAVDEAVRLVRRLLEVPGMAMIEVDLPAPVLPGA